MQLPLLRGAGSGRLFVDNALKRYLSENRTKPIPGEAAKGKLLADWIAALDSTSTGKETTLEQKFIRDVVCSLLGYAIYPPVPDTAATVWAKPPSDATGIGTEPDLCFGRFTSDEEYSFVAVGELKPPGTPFDIPQPRKGARTPVEQAFEYGTSILGVRWVLVSDMRLIRLYGIDSLGSFEQFDLSRCIDIEGRPTEEFKRLYFILHHDFLVAGGEQSAVSSLYAKGAARRLDVRDSFYSVYYQIRSDLYQGIRDATAQCGQTVTREELLEATQRLSDRIVFICYCETHPEALIPRGTLSKVTSAARMLPGPKRTKVYDALKELFREVDSGSYQTDLIRIDGYNGELFKDHAIIDHIDLPDKLHDRVYTAREPGGRDRRVEGVWGLHIYDFWLELDEHLLGHIFEQSLSDLAEIAAPGPVSDADKLRERKEKGIFYTTHLLSDFMATSAIGASLDDHPIPSVEDEEALMPMLESRLGELSRLRILDMACGSGAFLVSAYASILQEYWRIQGALSALHSLTRPQQQMFAAAQTIEQARVLRESLFGIDLLPQAAEIAKLALWLRSARKGERLSNLLQNIVVGDSLDIESALASLGASVETFDLVIGNPPWGGSVSELTYAKAVEVLGLGTTRSWDSWELFVGLGLRALKDGGRLSLLVPDSFFYSDKVATRRRLFEIATFEKVYNLGPDWFGPTIRMGTVLLQLRKVRSQESYDFRGMLLAGPLRAKAIRGEVPLTQIEAQRSRDIPSGRCVDSSFEIEVFRGRADDRIMEVIERKSVALSSICDRARGEEVNKGGLLWVCSSCLHPTTPGKKEKGGLYRNKDCPNCGLELSSATVSAATMVTSLAGIGSFGPFIDGDDIARRYQVAGASKRLRLDVIGWQYKKETVYRSPKILIRQAGIGLFATYDETGARCPQSVYIYRLTDEALAEGYKHEFVLAALLSRTMAYYIFKRFGEVDPAKAHAKLTHTRLAELPIPKVDFSQRSERSRHDAICERAHALLSGECRIGGKEDLSIEVDLRTLWGIDPADGSYINSEFADLPESQVVHDLFPDGVPRVRGRLSRR